MRNTMSLITSIIDVFKIFFHGFIYVIIKLLLQFDSHFDPSQITQNQINKFKSLISCPLTSNLSILTTHLIVHKCESP